MYLMFWMENIHHTMVPFIAVYILYNSCGNEEGWPWPSEKGGSYTSLTSDKRWGYFRDDVCWMEYNKGYGMLLAMTNGYLTWGWVVLQWI